MTPKQYIALSAVAATTAIGFAALLNVGSGIDLTAFSVTPTADTTTVADTVTCSMTLAAAEFVPMFTTGTPAGARGHYTAYYIDCGS